MEKFIIRGGNRLEGTVTLSGAKNSALKVLCSSILTYEKVRLFNMPTKMGDVKIQIDMLRGLGAKVIVENDGVFIDNSLINRWDVSVDEGRSIRTSLLMLGSLLGRFGKARVPLPGGCNIGERKFDLHIYALERLGAKVRETSDGYLEAECDGLWGAEIEFPARTIGGTENAILAACLAKGITIIKNAATRPEVFDLANFLNAMGAKINILGASCIEIEGVSELHGTTYSIISDPIEAFTFVIATVVTKGEVEIRPCPIDGLEVPIIYLRVSGVNFHPNKDTLKVNRIGKITCLDIATSPYPGIFSDFQPFFTVFASQAEGVSRITDNIQPRRFQYVTELKKLGADISTAGNTAVVKGTTCLRGAHIVANDLRAGAALVVAGLCAEGETIIDNAYQIDRGYEEIEKKFGEIGARIERMKMKDSGLP